METLMELVNGCKKVDFKEDGLEEKFLKIEELRQLGFKAKAAELQKEMVTAEKLTKLTKFGYIEIFDKQVEKYLRKKADYYNKHKAKNKGKKVLPQSQAMDQFIRAYEEIINPPIHTISTTVSGITYPSPISRYRSRLLDGYSHRNNRTITQRTNDYDLDEEGTIGMYIWTETKVKDYEGIPPANVLDTMKVHKQRNVFDYYTIAEVNGIVDPLLFGKISNYEGRFFIAQWGDDVQLDDLI
jgi:hypothetical protein